MNTVTHCQSTNLLKVALVNCQSDIQSKIQALLGAGQVTLTVDDSMSLGGGLKQGTFDAILLDWRDSQGDHELLRCLSPQIPVLVIVEPEQEELGARSLQVGVQDYVLTSELEVGNLKRAIHKAVQRHQRLHALESKLSQATAELQAEIKESEGIYTLLQAEEDEAPEAFPHLPSEGKQIKRKIVERVQVLLEQKKNCHLGADSKESETASCSPDYNDQFLANLYHEIRTPISGILGIVDLVLQTSLSAQQQDFLNTLRSSASNLLIMINDLLDLSKLDADAMHLEQIDFDLGQCIEEVLELLAVPANHQNTELFYFLGSNVPLTLQGDPYRLRQVLTNLLSNAIKFTHNGEVILRVSLEEEANTLEQGESKTVKLRFDVEDTGVGISPEGQSRLFQLFSQVNTSITRQYGGTGLGLVICKQLVELMGGEIGVESERGKGSTFWFTTRFVTSAPSCFVKPHNFLQGLKLLIIDDSMTRRQMIRAHTQDWGVECDEILSFQAGIEQLNKGLLMRQSYDVVIIQLPSTKVAQKLFERVLCTNKEVVRTRWVVTISIQQHQQFESLKSQGVNHYLLKPLQPSRLLDSLCKVARVQAPTAKTKLPTPTSASSSLESVKILLVEDTPISRKVILNQLNLLGAKADWVSDGQQALEQLAIQKYDLILMDCSMPVLDGYETTRYLRQREGINRHTVVVALTAGSRTSEQERCFLVGMNDYVNKPLGLKELEKVISRWSSRNQEHCAFTESCVQECP